MAPLMAVLKGESLKGKNKMRSHLIKLSNFCLLYFKYCITVQMLNDNLQIVQEKRAVK